MTLPEMNALLTTPLLVFANSMLALLVIGGLRMLIKDPDEIRHHIQDASRNFVD